ncbi:hypothetical protein RJ641_011786 [Dillenia turbinata]|uniref:Uncharacterized protein n=1 Tax=Dillenia turbinata TaxID=194707 RepID=A0AAN8V678_9MAGN
MANDVNEIEYEGWVGIPLRIDVALNGEDNRVTILTAKSVVGMEEPTSYFSSPSDQMLMTQKHTNPLSPASPPANPSSLSTAPPDIHDERYCVGVKRKSTNRRMQLAIVHPILDTILCNETSKDIWYSLKKKYEGFIRVKQA